MEGRHATVPRGTTLIKLGHGVENGRRVFYYVPEVVATLYAAAVGSSQRHVPPTISAAAAGSHVSRQQGAHGV